MISHTPLAVRAAAFLSATLLFSTVSAMPPPAGDSALAASLTEGTASVTVTQKSSYETLGTWTLLDSLNKEITIGVGEYTAANIIDGKYTLFINAPAGSETVVKLYDGDTLLQTNDHPQMSFDLPASKNYTVKIEHKLVYFGTVGASTTPSGIPFEIKGPDGITRTGISPQSYESMPIGDYSIRFKPIGCTEPPPKSGKLEKAKRLYFSIDIKCDTFQSASSSSESVSSKSSSSEKSSSRSSRAIRPSSSVSSADKEEQSSSSASVEPSPFPSSSEGASVPSLFTDVLGDAWYASAVARAGESGILTGYKDPNGRQTGKFGPANPVLLSELAKIMQKLGKIDTDLSAEPGSPRLQGKWYSGYLAEAQTRGWKVYLDVRIDPDFPATRAQVMATLLEALDIPPGDVTGTVFKDVPRETEYGASIETAAAKGFISGKRDSEGNVIGFDPYARVTRAEMAKIIAEILQTKGM